MLKTLVVIGSIKHIEKEQKEFMQLEDMVAKQ